MANKNAVYHIISFRLKKCVYKGPQTCLSHGEKFCFQRNHIKLKFRTIHTVKMEIKMAHKNDVYHIISFRIKKICI